MELDGFVCSQISPQGMELASQRGPSRDETPYGPGTNTERERLFGPEAKPLHSLHMAPLTHSLAVHDILTCSPRENSRQSFLPINQGQHMHKHKMRLCAMPRLFPHQIIPRCFYLNGLNSFRSSSSHPLEISNMCAGHSRSMDLRIMQNEILIPH